MRLPPCPRTLLRTLILLALGALGSGAPARADAIRVVSTDERGVVLRLDVPAWTLSPDPGGRSLITGTGLPLLGEPGRPRLPYAAALVAVPPGARVSASVEGAEESRDGVRLVVGDRPGFREDVRGLGLAPTREPVAPIADGSWPPTPVELGPPFASRGQTMIALQIRPFRYDEAAGRLWARRSVTVRLSFTGGTAPAAALPAAPVEDRHWEPVFKRAVLNYEQGRRWRAAPASRRGPAPGTSGSLFDRSGRPARGLRNAAFDESQTEVRVRVDTTGVYGLEYDKLAAAGFPAGIPISELSVHRHEFVGYGSPPYVTVELPIEVEEGPNRNGTFDSGDRIDVWVQNWAERSRASFAQRGWGDAEVVYVTYKPAGTGLPIGLRSGWRATTPPVLPSYPWSQHWERNFYYFQFPPDTNTDQFSWTDVTTYYDRPDTFQFEVNQLDPARNVSFAITLQGRAEDAHFTWCNVENGSGVFTSVVDSALWSGRGLQTYAASLPGTAFSEGRTNRVQTWGKTNFGAPDPVTNNIARFGVDYFEATYWRQFQALDHMLACNSGDAVGEYEIQAGGFASDSIRAYDVTDSLNPVRLTDVVIPTGTHVLHLQDQTAGPRRAYAIFEQPRLLPPGRYTPVTRRQLYAQGSGDYLLIAPEAFLSAAQSLATLRRAEGLDVVVAPLESVCDEFNGGRVSSYAIRRFVRYAYDTWNASFVLLMGDGSEDPLHRLVTSGADVIPAQKVFGPVSVSTGGTSMSEIVPGDAWYVWAVDTPPNPGPALLPDLAVGRLPVRDPQQAADVVAKLVAYENVDTTQTWRRRILLHSDDAFSGVNTFGGGPTGSGYCYHDYELVFRDLNQAVGHVIADSAGLALCEIEPFDMNVYLANEPTDGGNPPCRPDLFATQNRTRANVTPLLFQRLNDGRLWWNYQGHANAQVLEHESIYLKNGDFPGNNDVQRFTNDGRPFFFSAFSCHANAFASSQEGRLDIGPSIGEDMVNLPRGGAIASWASVGYEAVPFNHSEHLNVMLARSLFWESPRDDYLGHGASVVLGESIVLTLLRNYPLYLASPSERDVGLTYTLLGDPATRLTVGAPQIVVTANHVPVSDGIPVFLPGASDTLLLEADLVSNAAIDSIALERTDGTGTTLLPASSYTLTPPFPDTAPGGGGGRRFHLAYRTQLTAGRYTYRLQSRDRYGVTSSFRVVFDFVTVLLAENKPIRDGDAVARDAALSLSVQSANLLDPSTDLNLKVDNLAQVFTANPATPARQFVLTWTHAPYALGRHTVELDVPGGVPAIWHFSIESQLKIANLMAFPNPFSDDSLPLPAQAPAAASRLTGTIFTFQLQADAPADLMLRVFTVNGRMVYEQVERSVLPGYQELRWNGRDAEGEKLANGIYFYRLVAKGPSGSASELGRLVKLRSPTRSTDTGTP